MAEGAPQRNPMKKPMFLASQRAKSFCVHFKRPDLGPPAGGCPNQIVHVVQSPTPHSFFPCLDYLIVNLSHEGKYL